MSKSIYSFILCFSFLLNSTYAQRGNTCNATVIKNRHYQGYIFDSAYVSAAWISVANGKVPFTPLTRDIIVAEDILKTTISSDVLHHNQIHGIDLPLKKYLRQYVGIVNNDKEKIIYIFFIRNKKELIEDISKHILDVSDGGSDYWTAKINISKGVLYEIEASGGVIYQIR